MNIGLLMVCGEDDILERTLAHNAQFVDWLYVLDGTIPNSKSKAICEAHPKCAGYTRDADLDTGRYGGYPRDGWRQHLYEQAAADHGRDHWFLLLHGDELWTGLPDTEGFDGFIFRLPFFFPREGEPWDDSVHPLDQLRWSLGPGWPEFRMFRGSPDVNFDPRQHFNVTPSGLNRIGGCDYAILHYLYRAPDAQRARAATHERSRFDPDNYQHITHGDNVYWTDEMIDAYRQQPQFRELRDAA